MPSWLRYSAPGGWEMDQVHCLEEDTLYFMRTSLEAGRYISVKTTGQNSLGVEWGGYRDAPYHPTEGTFRRAGAAEEPYSDIRYIDWVFQKAMEVNLDALWEDYLVLDPKSKRIGRMLRPVFTPEQEAEKNGIVMKEQLSQKYKIHEANKKLSRWSGVRVVEYWPGGYADLLVTEYISESDKAVLLKIPFQGGQVMKWFPKSQIARRMSKPDGIIWASVWIMKKLGLWTRENGVN